MNFIIFIFISEKNRLKVYIQFGTKLYHLTEEKKVKYKTFHGENEEKSEFGNPCSEYLRFTIGIPIMFGLDKYFFDYIIYLLDNHFSFIQLRKNNMAHLNQCLLLNIKKT